MPVIVVGADVPAGPEIVERLLAREGEVRVFVTDPAAAEKFREAGAKVALGDVSDFGHVQAAMTRCFSAVLLAEAAGDQRERSFARTAGAVVDGWRLALRDAEVRRAIWITDHDPAPVTPEHTLVVPTVDPTSLAERIAELDERASLA